MIMPTANPISTAGFGAPPVSVDRCSGMMINYRTVLIVHIGM